VVTATDTSAPFTILSDDLKPFGCQLNVIEIGRFDHVEIAVPVQTNSSLSRQA
jgi:hypothetical protein